MLLQFLAAERPTSSVGAARESHEEAGNRPERLRGQKGVEGIR